MFAAAAAIPLSLTPFFGRDEEVAALARQLESTRLLTLTGAGGSGKTRLAAEVASRVVPRMADGAGWIELAPLNDSDLLGTYMLDALGIEHGARPAATALMESLRDRHLLLVLDNCEHIVEAVAALADQLLRACPRLQILATSREALGIGGERAWLVRGLDVPPTASPALAEIRQAPAVQLFVDRAQAAMATFELAAPNAEAVLKICRRLDGLPLAIELAAARVRALPPDELANRLDDAFRILSSGSRTAVPRHRTLREAIDWSYQLLDEQERLLLQRLSMFAGDFTLNAAESVAADAVVDAADVLDTLGALVDKSLVVMRETAGTARYYLLETIRQYASARLRESGSFHAVCDRHASTYVRLVAEAAPHLTTRDRPRWVQAIHRELDNVRVALACTRDTDVASHLRIMGDLGWFWYSSGAWSEGRRWFEGAIALPWSEPMRRDRARTLLGLGVLAALQGDVANAALWLQESVELHVAVGDRSGESYALAYLGIAFGQRGDERAEAPLHRALEFFRKERDLYGLRLCLVVLSTYWVVRGQAERAREYGEEAVDVAREYGLDRELAIALQVLAGVHLKLRNVRQAVPLLRESIGALRRDPSVYWQARATQQMALAHFALGEAERGAFLMGASEVLRETIGSAAFGADRNQIDPALAAAREAIGSERVDAEWQRGRAVDLEALFRELSTGGQLAASSAPTVEPSTNQGAVLSVRALGPLEIERDGHLLPRDTWRYARPGELFLYLISHPAGRTREQIGVVFWPDASATQVKNNFHVMLHHVRKALGRADLISFEGDRYRIAWELGVQFDARTFEDQARAVMASLKSARKAEDVPVALDRARDLLSLYRGDFLAGEDVGDWHVDIRDRLRRQYADLSLLAGDRALEQGAFREAAEFFINAVRADELHEAAHRRLMIALARAGERSEAMRLYDRLSEALRSDLEAEPDKETRSLYERLKRSEPV